MAVKGRTGNIVLAAVALVVVTAAVVDAVPKKSGGPETAPAAAPSIDIAGRAKLADTLRARGAGGTLYVVDRACELHALVLPALQEVPAPRSGGCSALVSGSSPPPGWSLWPSNARLAAWCDRGRVLVAASTGAVLPMIGGCAPAWKPDGSITYLRRGAVVQFPRTGRAQELLSAAQLRSALGRGWRAERIAWLGPDRLAVAASHRARFALALFSGKDVVARVVVESRIDLRASPRGRFLVTRGPSGVRIYDTRRGLRPVREFRTDAAVAWSPDERWLIVARPTRVVLRRGGHPLVLPLRALDLAWTR